MDKVSNSKLSDVEKSILRDMRNTVKDDGLNITVHHFPQYGVTIAEEKLGNGSYISVAVASPSEKKYRRKVGEYHALERTMHGQTIFVAESHSGLLESLARMLRFSAWDDGVNGFGRDASGKSL